MPPGHNTIGVLQYNLPTTLLSCNTLRCLLQYTSWSQYTCVLQYNPCQASCYCNTTFSPLHHHIAIQFSSQLHQSCNTIPILQYTFTSHSSPSLAIQFIVYKTRSQYNFYYSNPSLAIQNKANYTPKVVIQFSYCNTIPRQLHPSLAIQSLAKKTNSQYNWAVAQIGLHFFFQLLEHTKKIYTFFFSVSRILK